MNKLKSIGRTIGHKILSFVLITFEIKVLHKYEIYTGSEVWAAVEKKYPTLMTTKWERIRTAGLYLCVSQKMIERIVKWDWTDSRKYHREKLNCAWFAPMLECKVQGVFGVTGIGVIYDKSPKASHAYNIVIVSTEEGPEARVLEPQNDQWVLREARILLYEMETGTVIL